MQQAKALLDEEDSPQKDDSIEAEEESTADDEMIPAVPPNIDLITVNMYKQCTYLSSKIPAFRNICQSFADDQKNWELFFQDSDPYHFLEESSGSVESSGFDGSNLTPFER